MQIFGTSCFVYIQNQPKLESCCEKSVFIGYEMSSLVYFKSKNQIKRVRCVKFCDNVVQKTEAFTIEPVHNVDQNIVKPYTSENTLVEQAQGNDQNSADPNISDDDASIICRKSARKLAKPVYLKDYVTMVDAPTDQNIDCL